MKMIPVKLHRDLYEGLEKVCSLYDKPDVTIMLNAVVLSFLNNVGFAPQSGIFGDEGDEQ